MGPVFLQIFLKRFYPFMEKTFRHTICPIVAAIIWGTAFSAQSIASQYLGTFSLNAFRSLLAALLLFLFIAIRKQPAKNPKKLWTGGIACGIALFLACVTQQYGISHSTAGKSGFVTALYIVLVPLFSLFLHKKPGKRIWFSVAIAVLGLYFLCVTENFTLGPGDLGLLSCAILFSIQILFVDRFSPDLDEISLTAAEFLVCGVLSLVCALLFEPQHLENYQACLGSLIYITVLSSCVGYTLQIVAQKGGNPSVVSLLMSLESVFAVIGGALLLHERLTNREYLGCFLMAIAVVLAQIPEKKKEEAEVVGS